MTEVLRQLVVILESARLYELVEDVIKVHVILVNQRRSVMFGFGRHKWYLEGTIFFKLHDLSYSN